MAQDKIITQYARMWPRELFQQPKRSPETLEVRKHLDQPGVYVLYRDEHPYYVGRTDKRLFSRIWNHANRPQWSHFNFWNYASAFVVPNPRHVGQIEGLLITTMTTANKATPKIQRIPYPLKVWKTIHKGQKNSLP